MGPFYGFEDLNVEGWGVPREFVAPDQGTFLGNLGCVSAKHRGQEYMVLYSLDQPVTYIESDRKMKLFWEYNFGSETFSADSPFVWVNILGCQQNLRDKIC